MAKKRMAKKQAAKKTTSSRPAASADAKKLRELERRIEALEREAGLRR